MRPETIYIDFMRCEDRSADLYLDLSIRFCDQIDLSWFWVELAMGSKQYAGLLQFCLENGLFARDLPDPSAIQSLQGRLDELGARASDPTLSLDGAFDIAIQVETSDIVDIRSRLTLPIQGPTHILKKKLDLVGANQVGKLKSGGERFGVSPGVRSRLGGVV